MFDVMIGEPGRAAKPARDPRAPTTAEIAKDDMSHWPYRSPVLSTVSGAEAKADSTTQTRVQKGPYQCSSADCCFIGGEMAANKSPGLMVDTETSMVQEENRCNRGLTGRAQHQGPRGDKASQDSNKGTDEETHTKEVATASY